MGSSLGWLMEEGRCTLLFIKAAFPGGYLTLSLCPVLGGGQAESVQPWGRAKPRRCSHHR